jgi:hypothetical protein
VRLRLFNLAAAVSLILLFAGATISVISFKTKISIPFKRDGRLWEAAVERGQLTFSDLPQRTADNRRWLAACTKYQAAVQVHLVAISRGDQEKTRPGLLAAMKVFEREQTYWLTWADKSPQIRCSSVETPLAFAAVLPICRAASWVPILKRRRLRRGQCVHCGYDLRATPHRCPECGNPDKNNGQL